ncbi:hypothetical protein Moror_17445, partial [Moniliophthora roreri MCA 2997]
VERHTQEESFIFRVVVVIIHPKVYPKSCQVTMMRVLYTATYNPYPDHDPQLHLIP